MKVPAAVVGMDLSDDGALLVVSINAGVGAPAAQVFRTRDGAIVASFGADTGAGYGVALAAGGREVWYLAEDDLGAKHLYRAAVDGSAAEKIAEYGLGERCHGLTRDAAGEQVAVLGNFVDVWHRASVEVGFHLEGPARDTAVHAVFSADARSLFTYGTVEHQVVQYTIGQDGEVARWPAPRPYGQQLASSPSGRLLVAVGTGTEGVFVIDTASGERVAPAAFNESSLIVGRYTFSQDSSVLVYGARAARGWPLSGGELIRGPELGAGGVLAIASARRSPRIAFGQSDGGVCLLTLGESPQRSR